MELAEKRIKNGKKFDHLIKGSNCVTSDLGTGNDTNIEGMKFMSELAQEHSDHVRKLAQRLKTGNLLTDVDKVHNFLYDHIQYDPDDRLQKLRTPGCSWNQRNQGIDCKSFTLFASSLMKEMGYISYMRQIKQPGMYEDFYTHVYTVVPVDQKTGDLNQGYYIIDATVSDNQEVPFLQKNDIMITAYNGMNGSCNDLQKAKTRVKVNRAGRRLQEGKSSGGRDLALFRHRGMLGSQNTSLDQLLGRYNFSRPVINQIKSKAIEIVKEYGLESLGYTVLRNNQIVLYNKATNQDGFVFSPKKSMNAPQQQFDPAGDLGGSDDSGNQFEDVAVDLLGDFSDAIIDFAGGLLGTDGFYEAKHVTKNVEFVLDLYAGFVDGLNNGVSGYSPSFASSITAENIHELKHRAKSFALTLQAKKDSDNWVNETESNLQTTINILENISTEVNKLVDAYVNTYLEVDPMGAPFSKDYSQVRYEPGDTRGTQGQEKKIDYNPAPTSAYNPKSGVSIPSFSLPTQTIEKIIQGQTIDESNWLNDLTDILVDNLGGGSNNGGGNNGGVNNNGNDQFDQGPINADFGDATIAGIKTSTIGYGVAGLSLAYLFRDQISKIFK